MRRLRGSDSDNDAEIEAARPSKLARFLTDKFNVGFFSGSDVQEISAKSLEDFPQPTMAPAELRVLAGMGSDGLHKNHVYGQLCAAIERQCTFSGTIETKLPMKNLKVHKLQQYNPVQNHIEVAPHLVVAGLWAHHKPVFWRRMFGATYPMEGHTVLTNFWAGLSPRDPRVPFLTDAFVRAGVAADPEDFRRRAIPVNLHGDAVPVTKRMSLDCVSWSSALSHRLPTKQAKWFISGSSLV